MQRVRVGVIGAGTWGINHVRAFAAAPGCELVAIAEQDESRHPRVAEIAPDAECVTSAQHVLESHEVDAVVIATPAVTHVEFAEQAFRAGKHVLVEKPVAMSTAGARRIQAAMQASGCIGMAGHLMVFHPAVRRIRSLVHEQALGTVYYVHATRVNLGRLRSDENALWSFGPHDLSMIATILGEQPVAVSACGAAVLQPGIEDVVFVTLRYATGVLGHLHLSWLHPRKERRLIIVGSQRMVEFDDVSREKLKIYDKGYDRPPEFTNYSQFLTIRDGDVHIPQLPMEEPLSAEIQHFLDCIAQRRTPESDLASAMRVTAVLEAAEQSLRANGAMVAVPP